MHVEHHLVFKLMSAVIANHLLLFALHAKLVRFRELVLRRTLSDFATVGRHFVDRFVKPLVGSVGTVVQVHYRFKAICGLLLLLNHKISGLLDCLGDLALLLLHAGDIVVPILSIQLHDLVSRQRHAALDCRLHLVDSLLNGLFSDAAAHSRDPAGILLFDVVRLPLEALVQVLEVHVLVFQGLLPLEVCDCF